MQILRVASNLDGSGWLRGVVGAFISGGAASIASGSAASYLDKGHDINILELMGLTFLIAGVVSMMKFLETEPLPPPKQ